MGQSLRQRIYSSVRTLSTAVSSKDVPMQPLPACSVKQSGSWSILPGVLYPYYRQSRERLRGHMFGRGWAVLCVLSLIYILWSKFTRHKSNKNVFNLLHICWNNMTAASIWEKKTVRKPTCRSERINMHNGKRILLVQYLRDSVMRFLTN